MNVGKTPDIGANVEHHFVLQPTELGDQTFTATCVKCHRIVMTAQEFDMREDGAQRQRVYDTLTGHFVECHIVDAQKVVAVATWIPRRFMPQMHAAIILEDATQN